MVRVNIHEQILRQRAGLTGWKAWLAMAASLVVGVTLFLLAASLALILIPVIAIAGAIGMWRLRRRMREAGFMDPPNRPVDPYTRDEIIDAEYRIIDANEPPKR